MERAHAVEAATHGMEPTALARAATKFAQLDADGSGALAGEELAALSEWAFASFHPEAEAMGEEARAGLARKVLSRTDADGDGAMDFGEFGQWYSNTRAPGLTPPTPPADLPVVCSVCACVRARACVGAAGRGGTIPHVGARSLRATAAEGELAACARRID